MNDINNEKIEITECKDGWWLYDTTRGMNLSMRADSKEDALLEALTYYQNRLLEAEGNLRYLREHVNTFVDSVTDEDGDIL